MATYSTSPLGLVNWEGIKSFEVEDDFLKSNLSSTGRIKIGVKPDNQKVQSRILVGKGAATTLHKDDIYEATTQRIIETFETIPSMKLKAADFAYLKDFGVYPNNRLAIVRRFGGPIPDNLFKINNPPVSTMLTYFDESDFMLDFTVSEEWEDAPASFKEILNRAAKDFRIDKVVNNLGDYMGGAGGIVPLPGATHKAQRTLLKELGIISDEDDSYLPTGDPNLIRSAQVRKLPDEADSSFEGVKCKFNITLKFVYEQKFIGNVDPTIAFYDILNNLLTMGTSESTTYLGKNVKLASTFEQTLNSLSNGFAGLMDIVDKVGEFLKKVITDIATSVQNFFIKNPSGQSSESEASFLGKAFNAIKTAIDDIISFITLKYRIPILGVISSLTGLPSTPWHITLGNPFRPIFVSGDMLCESVDIKLGSKLSFNDLPSTIEASVKLTSARNLGLQEIMSKFLDGQIRTTKGSYMTLGSETVYNGTPNKKKTQTIIPGNITQNSSSRGEEDITNNISGTNSNTQTKIGNTTDENKLVNPDTNSGDGPIINTDPTLNIRSINNSNTPQNSSGENNKSNT